MWGVFNIEYGKLENGELECLFSSKIFKTGISKKLDGKLENKLENGYLESAVGNWKVCFIISFRKVCFEIYGKYY